MPVLDLSLEQPVSVFNFSKSKQEHERCVKFGVKVVG